MQRSGKVKIAIVASLFAKRNMNINASQLVCDLMNNFTEMNTIKTGKKIRRKDFSSLFTYLLPDLLTESCGPAKQYPAFR
jgi:hypothetical protein